jgi:CheY-like chemotaxis protein
MADLRAPQTAGQRPRVLVVEDEFLIALELEEMLQELGCEVIGPIGTIKEALEICQSMDADAAIVDLVLHGEPADPIAKVLTARNIPFGFASGMDSDLGNGWQELPFVKKPYLLEDLCDFLRQILPTHPR